MLQMIYKKTRRIFRNKNDTYIIVLIFINIRILRIYMKTCMSLNSNLKFFMHECVDSNLNFFIIFKVSEYNTKEIK
jgi:hypothetical protein